MKIKTLKKHNNNKYKIVFDNEESVILYDDIIVKHNLLTNNDLNEKLIEDIVKENGKMDAYYSALKSLSGKMRTKKEIYKYLKTRKHDEQTIIEVIKRLYQENYMNDRRYIKAYVNDQLNLTDKGPNKMKRELIDLGFKESYIKDFVDVIDDDVWIERMDKIITKKLKLFTNLSAYNKKMKIINDLVIKGYYRDLIVDVIENYEFKNNPEAIMADYKKILKRLENKYEGYELRFHLKAKLMSKGYTSAEIEQVLEEEY